MEKTKFYANFAGDEYNGKVYKFGEPIDDSVDAGTLQYLEQTGRITRTPPDEASLNTAPLASDKPLGEMNRAELEAAALATLDLSQYSDDELRERIEAARQLKAERDGEASPTPAPAPQDETGQGGGEGEGDDTIDDAELSPMLDGSVEDLKGELAKLDDVAKVERLRELESAGAKRTTALAAIDARIAALKSTD